jgi:hypothetical protein
MFEIKMTLLVLSRLYEILKSNENMTPEEYIKSKRHEDYPGGHLCYTVSEEDALKAIEMARNENKNNTAAMQGWICPKCGRVYSPYTSMCSHCGNANDFKITCKL